jgi:hypothetical protein
MIRADASLVYVAWFYATVSRMVIGFRPWDDDSVEWSSGVFGMD